jgi:hypothetical protein
LTGHAFDRHPPLRLPPPSRALDVEFVSGRRYRYRAVPEDVAARFRAAFSKGASSTRTFATTTRSRAAETSDVGAGASGARRRASVLGRPVDHAERAAQP